MEIRSLEKSKDKKKMSFLISKTTPAYINSLRRIMMNKVPVLAIEDVEIKKNSSAMYDEMLAHRLGLIPLKTDLKAYETKKKKKEVKFTLKTKATGIIYSSALKSDDPKIKPIYDNIPIVKLKKGDEIELTATAVLGQGKDHVKWSPCHVYFRNKPKIEIKKDIKDAQRFIDICPKNVFELKNNKLSINQDNVMDCTLCNACNDIAKNKEVSATAEKDKFLLFIESWGQLEIKEIGKKAIEIFDSTLDEFAEKVKKIK